MKRIRHDSKLGAFTAFLLFGASLHLGAELPDFDTQVHPLLERHCFACHDSIEQKGSLDLEVLTRETDYRARPTLLEDLDWVIGEHEMPPTTFAHQPTKEERQVMLDWIQGSLLELQNAQPNDPGLVVSPRINSSEYDHVIRDLTGEQLGVGQLLTQDSPGGEGFLNVGANLTLSVGQFESFLSAAKNVLNHARIGVETGPVFYDRPVGKAVDNKAYAKSLATIYMELLQFTYEEWSDAKKRAIRDYMGFGGYHRDEFPQIVAWLEAAWQYRFREELGMPDATLAEVGARYPVPLPASGMEKLWAAMTEDRSFEKMHSLMENPLFRDLVDRWQMIPAPTNGDPTAAREAITAAVRETLRLADKLGEDPWSAHRNWSTVEEVIRGNAERKEYLGRARRGRVPVHLHPQRSETGEIVIAVSTLFDGPEGDFIRLTDFTAVMEDGRKLPWEQVISHFETSTGGRLNFGAPVGGARPGPGEIVVPGGHWVKFQVPEGLVELKGKAVFDPDIGEETTSQILSWDRPPPHRDVFHGRTILGNVSSPHAKKVQNTMEEMTSFTVGGKLRDEQAYWALDPELRDALGVDGSERWRGYRGHSTLAIDAQEVIDRMEAVNPDWKEQFDETVALIHDLERHRDAETSHTRLYAEEVIREWANEAWRREVTERDIEGLLALYDEQRALGETYENSVRQALYGVLMSPRFLYRLMEGRDRTGEPYPLNDWELANRLSFFLWGSLPDDELLDAADSGALRQPAVLSAQAERMVRDPKFLGFIDEFASHWLDFADYEEKAAPDQERFEYFTPELKEAMREEVVLFLMDIFQNNQPLTGVLDAEYTYLNELLAKHYDLYDDLDIHGSGMRKVNLPPDAPRGGVLGMAAFLTMQSKPLRSDPIHRGIWVYESVLGKPIPEPPPNVPILSDEEVSEEGLTVAQQLAKHRDDPACFSCHDRFDPLGVALENFDPIGRWRTEITDGVPVDSLGEFGDGTEVKGFQGLKEMVLAEREAFLNNFTRKLIGYGLNRGFMLSDKPLQEEMIEALKANDYRPMVAIEALVNSPQFLNRRDKVPEQTLASD